MPMTAIRPDAQVQNSTTYNDQVAPGIAMQTSAVYLEDDLSGLRSQVRSALGTTHWYDPLATTANGKQRAIAQLNSALDVLETKTIISRSTVLTAVNVPAGQNYVILSVSGNQAPTLPAAIGPTSLGAIAALSTQTGASFAANELITVAGADALTPKNLCLVHNNANAQVVETSSGQADILALLQVEGGAQDGSSFNDTSGGARVKLSFVYQDQSTKTLKAVAASDIGGITINFSYQVRNAWLTAPENAFTGNASFIDQVGSVDITLTQATANQAGAGIPVNTPVLWRVATSQQFAIQSATGASTYFAISPSGSSTAATLTTNTFSIATQSPVTSTAGMTVAQGTQSVNVGVTAGQVDSAGLTVASTGSNPLKLNAGGAIAFKDGYLAGSNWTSAAVNLANGTTDINAYRAAFGEVSLMAGIVAAANSAKRSYVVADVVGGNFSAGTNMTGAGANANLSSQLPDFSKATNPATQIKVWRNGMLLRYGVNAAAGNDWTLGQVPANGDLQFASPLRGSTGGYHADCIVVECFGF